MRIGSTIELVDDNWQTNRDDSNYKIRPVKNKPYTIRDLYIHEISNQLVLRLEEIVNKPLNYINGLKEPSWNAYRFRELLPPIENIEKYINENTVEILEPIEL